MQSGSLGTYCSVHGSTRRLAALTFRVKLDSRRGKMLDPLLAVGIAAVALTTFSLALARLIPDRYDNMELRRVPARRR